MKNKKLLTRLFALLASLVLVLALSLPCFADTVESDPYIVKYIEFSTVDEYRLWFYDNSTKVTMIVVQGYMYFYNNGLYFLSDGLSTQQPGNTLSVQQQFSVFYFNDGNSYFDTLYANWSTGTYTATNVYREEIPVEAIRIYYFDTADFSSSEPTVGGWYGDIKNIILDAVFGQDAVLNESQEFTLNQISLWLSLIVILLPFVIVAVIVVRCFR